MQLVVTALGAPHGASGGDADEVISIVTSSTDAERTARTIEEWSGLDVAIERFDLSACAAASAEAFPTASVVKLAVAATVALAMDAGTLRAEDRLRVTAGNRSIPSGVLQELPDGSVVTVRRAVLLMLSVSDNTAMDLLVHAVGRSSIEAFLDDGDAGTALPFLTTREAYLIRARLAPFTSKEFMMASKSQQRAYLDRAGSVALPEASLPSASLSDGPAWSMTIRQLCRSVADLVCSAAWRESFAGGLRTTDAGGHRWMSKTGFEPGLATAVAFDGVSACHQGCGTFVRLSDGGSRTTVRDSMVDAVEALAVIESAKVEAACGR